MCILSRVQLFETPWTVAHQATLSMGFSRQEYWSGLPFPTPGDVPDTGIKHSCLLHWQADAILSILNSELPDVQASFRKGRGTRDQIADTDWIIKKARELVEKHLFLLYWLCQSLWLCGSPQTVENSWRDGNTRPPDLPLEKPVCRSGSNS